MSFAAEVLAKLPSQLDHAVLYREPGEDGAGDFDVLGDPPAWFGELFGSAAEAEERSHFLADFIEHRAAEHWAAGDSKPLSSGYWEEAEGRFFEAQAWSVGERNLLLLSSVDEAAHAQQQLVQRNHEQVLDRRRLMKEIEKKEILLDCIVHDLAGPVGTLIMNIEHIGRTLGERSSLQPAVGRALSQAQRQLTMIRSISHLFAGDLSGDEDDDGVAGGVDIIAAAHEMADVHRATGGNRRIQFRLNREGGAGPLMVVGREAHLSRVIENLLLNAIRHTAADGEISITVETPTDGDAGLVELRVEDNGSGVEPELADDLFRPFTQGREKSGQSGLGLYFCRIAVEQYGGSIGFRDREDDGEKGACFWFRLRTIEASSGEGTAAANVESQGS